MENTRNTMDERKIQLRNQVQRNIEIPFKVKYVQQGAVTRAFERDRMDILELRGIINRATAELKENKIDNEGINIEFDTIFAGRYTVNISLDEYAILYNILKDVEIRLHGIDCDDQFEQEM